MGSIYQALLRASAERKSSKKSESLPTAVSSPPPADPTDSQMEDEEMMGLVEAVESLETQKRHKVIQFVGSRDGLRSSPLARKFALTSASTMGLSVALMGDGVFETGDEGYLSQSAEAGGALNPGSREHVDQAFGKVKDAGLFTYRSDRINVHGALIIESSGNGSIWERMRSRFDLVVIESSHRRGSSKHPTIQRKADGIALVFESDIVEPALEAGVEDIGLATVLELVAQGAIIPRQVVQCMGWTVLLLIPADLGPQE